MSQPPLWSYWPETGVYLTVAVRACTAKGPREGGRGGRKDADSTKYTMVSQAELEFPAISTGLL